MTPEFARCVDPVLLDVLDVLERIRDASLQQTPSEVKELLLISLNRAEMRCAEIRTEWIEAKYALVALIDELLMTTEWIGKSEFGRKPRTDTFGTIDASRLFYDKVRKTVTEGLMNAAEVFYMCVALGFARYRDENRTRLLIQDGFPADIGAWFAECSASSSPGRGRGIACLTAVQVLLSDPLDR